MSARHHPAAQRWKAIRASVLSATLCAGVLLVAPGALAQAADATAPPAPELVLPLFEIVNPLPGFVWTPVADACSSCTGTFNGAPGPSETVSGVASYTFELSEFASFSSIFASSVGTATGFQLPANKRLSFGSTYYWRVTVSDLAGNSRTTSTRSFTVKQRSVQYKLSVDDDCSSGFSSPAIELLTRTLAATDLRFPLSEGV